MAGRRVSIRHRSRNGCFQAQGRWGFGSFLDDCHLPRRRMSLVDAHSIECGADQAHSGRRADGALSPGFTRVDGDRLARGTDLGSGVVGWLGTGGVFGVPIERVCRDRDRSITRPVRTFFEWRSKSIQNGRIPCCAHQAIIESDTPGGSRIDVDPRSKMEARIEPRSYAPKPMDVLVFPGNRRGMVRAKRLLPKRSPCASSKCSSV